MGELRVKWVFETEGNAVAVALHEVDFGVYLDGAEIEFVEYMAAGTTIIIEGFDYFLGDIPCFIEVVNECIFVLLRVYSWGQYEDNAIVRVFNGVRVPGFDVSGGHDYGQNETFVPEGRYFFRELAFGVYQGDGFEFGD